MKTSTASANASTVMRSRIFVISRLVPRQSRKKVQRAGDEDGRVLARAGERSGGIGLDLDLGESGARRGARARRPGARGRSGDCVATKRRPLVGERREHRARVLVAQDRRDDGVVVAVELRGEPGGRRRRCGRRPRPRRRAARAGRAARPRPRARRGGPGRRRPPRARRRRRRSGRRGGRTPRPGSTAIVPSWTTASFSAAISSRVSPSTSVCSSPTLVSRTTCERSTLVASSRPPSPASTTATSTSRARELRERGRAERLELRRLLRLGLGPDASDRRLEVDLLAVDGDPLGPGADVRRDRRADRRAPRRAAAPRSSGSPSTCRSCRRRGSPGTRAAGRRAPPAASASARARTPSATG